MVSIAASNPARYKFARIGDKGEPDEPSHREADGDIDIDTPQDEYLVALDNARRAARKFEKALAANRARRASLAKLPFPWVRPGLKTLLWTCGFLLAGFAHTGTVLSWWQPAALIPPLLLALGLTAGENLGRAIRALANNTRPVEKLTLSIAITVQVVILTANTIVLANSPFPSLPHWYGPAVAGLSLAAAATLPWFGTSQKEYVRLRKAVQTSNRARRNAYSKARRAVDKLAEIHAIHLQQMPERLQKTRSRKI